MLSRYVIWEVLKPSMVFCGLFVLLFAGFSWVTFLGQAVDALLPFSMVFVLIALKVGIALEILLPVSLYFGVIMGLGRMHADSEMKALLACGVSPFRVLRIILFLSAIVALLVGMFSLYLRPLAYEHSYRLRAEGEAGLGMGHLDAGHFYERRDGSLVLFADGLDSQRRRLLQVFVQSEKGENLRILSAKEAEEHIDPETGIHTPVLYDGYEYKFTRTGEINHMAHFVRLSILPQEAKSEYKKKAVPTHKLWFSSSRKDLAELQWRFSTPWATILLGLLGVPLSRSSPRQGKYAKVFTATLIFAAFYFSAVMTKSLIEEGAFPLIPGMWSIVISLGVLLAILLASPKYSKNLT